jgi:hypothetical protein
MKNSKLENIIKIKNILDTHICSEEHCLFCKINNVIKHNNCKCDTYNISINCKKCHVGLCEECENYDGMFYLCNDCFNF